jgi:glycosyltransferase 2 family protein
LNKKALKTIQFFVFLALGVLLMYLAFKGIDLNLLWNGIKQANYWWILLSLIFATGGFILRGIRWKILIEPLGFKPKNTNIFYAVMTAYIANLAFPRMGEIARCGALTRTDKVPFDSLVGTVIVERIVDFVTLLVLIAIVLIAKFEMVGGFFMKEILDPLMAKFSSGTLWILGFVALVAIVLVFVALNMFKEKVPLFKKILGFVTGIFSGIKSVIRMKKRGWFLLHTALIWTMYWLGTYVVFFAIGPTSHLNIFDALFILVIGGLGMTAPVQGGFGAFHWIISLGLILYGIPQDQGLLYATLLHESQVVYILLVGGFSLFMVFFSRRQASRIGN